ncbi:MAG: Trap dicarboxylate transporter, dctp subunit [Parcubacteria bacterium 34_609]|nr:MAG: Trap dicarboxylate transporter, dctp subunit [Parcubacteria bacterium 34_609]
MFSKKSILSILTVLMVLSCFVFSVQAADGPIILKLAHNDANILQVPKQSAAVVMKHFIESESNGRLKMEIYPAGQLGGEKENVEATIANSIQMTIVSDGPLPGFFPDIQVLSIPYSFPSPIVAWDVMEGPFGRNLVEKLREATGLRCLGYSEVGARHFTNSKRPISKPEDLKGLKIRVMENFAHIIMVESLGANPTAMNFNELYSALQTGVVDGQENPINTISYAKLNEVQKYITLDGHIYTIQFILINDNFYNNLPPDLQRVIDRAAKIGETVARGTTQLYNAVLLKDLEESGMKITYLTEEQRQEFIEKSRPQVIEWLLRNIDAKLVESFLLAIDESCEKYGLK